MYCRFCGNEIPDDSKFCKVCGKPVGDSSDVNDKNMQHNNVEDDNIDRAILKNKNGEPYVDPKTGDTYTYNPRTDILLYDPKTGKPLLSPRTGKPIVLEKIIRQEKKSKPFILKILTAILRIIAVPVLLIVKFLKLVVTFLTYLGGWMFYVVAFLGGILTLYLFIVQCCMKGGWSNWLGMIMILICTLLIYAVPKVIAYVYVGLEIARIFLHNFIWPKHKITLQNEVVI